MSQLCVNLPPLAPDYCGIGSALFDLGGMIVIHDAAGCTGNYLGYDEPRWFGSKQSVFCSGLRHIDAALGNDSVFIERIGKAAAKIKPNFIAFIGSPVPFVIGTDYHGFATELEKHTGIPCFGFDVAGIDIYTNAVSDAINRVLERFCKGEKKLTNPQTKRINLLGITPIDFAAQGNDHDFKKLFEDAGYTVNNSFSIGMDFEALRNTADANLNVVVSGSGLGTAKYLKEKYGMPYVIGTPLGKNPYILKKVAAFFEGKHLPDLNAGFENTLAEAGGVLIAGDQVIASSIREELRLRGYKKRICTAIIFKADSDLLTDADEICASEKEIRDTVRVEFDTLVSDPLIYDLAHKDRTKNVSFPQPSVSGRLCWNTTPAFVGEEMERILKTCL